MNSQRAGNDKFSEKLGSDEKRSGRKQKKQVSVIFPSTFSPNICCSDSTSCKKSKSKPISIMDMNFYQYVYQKEVLEFSGFLLSEKAFQGYTYICSDKIPAHNVYAVHSMFNQWCNNFFQCLTHGIQT